MMYKTLVLRSRYLQHNPESTRHRYSLESMRSNGGSHEEVRGKRVGATRSLPVKARTHKCSSYIKPNLTAMVPR